MSLSGIRFRTRSSSFSLALGYPLFHSGLSLDLFSNYPNHIMQTVLGPFHPYLETALVDEILQYKCDDPFRPLLILLPSDSLRRHLKIVLSRQRRLSLLNVHLLTFFQLSSRLYAEGSSDAPKLRDDLFIEEVVRRLIRARQAGAEAFAGIEERLGGCAALWQTLRDLRDAGVDPQLGLEGLCEGQFGRGTHEHTAHILVLLQTLLRSCELKAIRTQAELDQRATAQVPSSSYLRQFGQVFYYGFYDLTQIQIDLFHAVAQNYPATLFFPLLPGRPGHQGWRFAERFYERHVQGFSSPTRDLTAAGTPALPRTFQLFDEDNERTYIDLPDSWHCTISNAFGVRDEVAAAAKEILRLIDHQGLSFSDIGVVARNLESYGASIKEIFREHQIPVMGEFDEPLVQFPLTKAVILLLNLPAKDFLRAQVIDLLSSPYFQTEHFTGAKDWARPDLWDLATRELAICKGLQEWRRLRNYTNRDIVISQLSHDEEPRVIRITIAQLRCLAEIVEGLAGDLLNLPPSAPWNVYAGAWKKLLKKYLGVAAPDEATGRAEELLHEQILAILDQLAGLDLVDDDISLSDFSATFEYWLERSSIALNSPNNDGITVLNAAAARGISFRTLFVLGLNEGVFPRAIREDAFLRDRDREVLERDLGYKINQKLAGFDEEKLLFTLLVGGAEERLYCSFQRADESGRVLAASWYLSALERAIGRQSTTHLTKVTIPRSNLEKATTPPFDQEKFLTPEELAVRLSLEGKDPTPLIERFALAPALYKPGRKVVIELDRSTERLCAFDGAVGPLDDYWKHFSGRGLSPTALESYARCPFQFFARYVLGLERLERPEETLGPSAAEYGELGHAILAGVYQTLIERGTFEDQRDSVNLEATLVTVANQIFAEYEAKNPVGYPLAWRTLKTGLTQLLHQVIAEDIKELSDSGFKPVSVEAEMTDQLAADWPEPSKGMTIRGRMDRIDRNPGHNHLRVIDYKFKFGVAPATQDKNLTRAALRGERLQPPFYCLLGRRWAAERTPQREDPRVQAKFYYLAPRWSEGPLVTATFGADGLDGQYGAEVKQTIAYLADGIRQGRFFIRRGEHCQHCDVAEICRKTHPPSLWRAENDPLTRAHREMHGKDSDQYER
jgi:ATP-dependent helicase/nuclease subunit B